MPYVEILPGESVNTDQVCRVLKSSVKMGSSSINRVSISLSNGDVRTVECKEDEQLCNDIYIKICGYILTTKEEWHIEHSLKSYAIYLVNERARDVIRDPDMEARKLNAVVHLSTMLNDLVFPEVCLRSKYKARVLVSLITNHAGFLSEHYGVPPDTFNKLL